jgi:hypothetical protein
MGGLEVGTFQQNGLDNLQLFHAGQVQALYSISFHSQQKYLGKKN